MSKKRLRLRKLKELFRLKFEFGLSNRQIAQNCNISHTTVGGYLDRLSEAGLTWADVKDMKEEELIGELFPTEYQKPTMSTKPEADWAKIFEELKDKDVTLQLLWNEYRQAYPQGYGYSQFCYLYQIWRKKLNVYMRQNHKGGDKLFVDYAGRKVRVTNPITGEVKEASIFVAVLGASNYTYVEAHFGQNLKHWLSAHARVFEFFQGIPLAVVPDNLKSGVKSPCYYDPDINPTYQDMATHYKIAVLPARVRRPKDKAKVEVGVQVVQRWILAALRKRTFFSLHELNQAIQTLLNRLNNREMRHIGKSRKELFEDVEKKHLRPLPAYKYKYVEVKKAKVGFDYHVIFEDCFYSVHYSLVGQEMEIRAEEKIIRIERNNQLHALHPRLSGKGLYSTKGEHMPPNHKAIAGWNPQRFIRWARKIGPHTTELIENILALREYPQQSYRKCTGILKLAKTYSNERLEAACFRALRFGEIRYKKINEILKKGYDKNESVEPVHDPKAVSHQNIRGTEYFQEKSL